MLVNLSANEYIKLVPNPFVSDLEFCIFGKEKGYQKHDIQIFLKVTSV
jgi:hypothetical protein